MICVKILTENTKAPFRAAALASYLGDGYSSLGARAQAPKDLMAFGSVLQHNQHNIGKCNEPYLRSIARCFDSGGNAVGKFHIVIDLLLQSELYFFFGKTRLFGSQLI